MSRSGVDKRFDPTTRPYAADEGGHYGPFGGRYSPEVLMPALEELEACYRSALDDPQFHADLEKVRRTFIGRPTPLYFCENLTRDLGGAKIYLKNEGLAHTGAHKINHCVGQALLAKRMGKRRIIAETGAGQHGVATATVCARFGLECVIYMGAIDMARQRPNVFWMQQLGAEVRPVEFGGKRLKDAVNAALKDWITNVGTTHYLIGSCLGSHPFPEMNRFFQSVVGQEIRSQLDDAEGRLPDYVIACVGGGSNSIGAFDEFLAERSVKLIGVEAGGKGIASGSHASRFAGGRLGVVEGYKSYWLLDQHGQVADTHSISAGLDYAGIGPLHALLHDEKRVEYTSATDEEVLAAFQRLARTEGVFSALESAHAVAHAIRLAPTLPRDKIIVVNLSGRGEKDIFILAKHLADTTFVEFLKDYLSETT
ncbi:MAG: tryptophan synthase subunit beta [Bdellovibrionales bacterium]|nr:tryptophan synthase subunit beta [Bdellovibrionales bacterium]